MIFKREKIMHEKAWKSISYTKRTILAEDIMNFIGRGGKIG
jgi:hypothetical protein